MNFLSIFDVIGPNMIGPFQFHTRPAPYRLPLSRKKNVSGRSEKSNVHPLWLFRQNLPRTWNRPCAAGGNSRFFYR